MSKIRSRLVEFGVTAQRADDPDNWEHWTIKLTLNNPDDRRNWLEMAEKSGYRNIRLVRVKADTSSTKSNKADIAREGLRILDELLAKRK